MDELLYRPRPRAVPGQADLFMPSAPAPAPRVDTIGSREAREAIAPQLESARAQVLEAIRRHGPISGAGLEQLKELSHLGTTTARRRAIDLRDAGLVVESTAVCAVTGRRCAHFEVAR
jgi:hypothetical protein